MMGRVWGALKFVGRWLGPMLILLAAGLVLFPPPMPFADPAKSAALVGAIFTAVACIFIRAPEQRRLRRIFVICALAAFAFTGWRYWEAARGYHKEIVHFDNRGAHLKGTLYLPDRAGKVPAMVLLTGSGLTPRFLYQDYAVHFAQAGYAVLLYDKRGVGESSGEKQAACFLCADKDLELLASDAAAGLSFLSARREVREEAVGFTGLSEGGLVAPRAAVLNGHAAFMLMITSPTTTLYDIANFQSPTGQAELQRTGIKDFDPMPSLNALDIPALWVMAGNDTLTPNSASIRNLENLRQLGKPNRYRVIPGAWHALFIAPKADVLDTMDGWLTQVTEVKQ
jgi:dienelactone hydrolase